MLRKAHFLIVGALVAGSIAGCGDSGGSAFGNGASNGASGASGSGGILGDDGSSGSNGGLGGKIQECSKMDIVFVVDNSNSMKEEQTNLASNFPKFMNVINQYKTTSGKELDYRVAVTSSDATADKGRFSAKRGGGAPAGCAAGPTRPWLERGDGNAQAVAGFFGCRAELGVGGSGVERPLEAMLLSVTARITDKANTAANLPFIRDDALMAFVVISDEDEGGSEQNGAGVPLKTSSQYVAAFDTVKEGRGRWAAAAIAGQQKCTSPGLGDAKEAKRLKEFVGLVGKNGVFSSICVGDLTQGLTDALKTFDQACKDFPATGVN